MYIARSKRIMLFLFTSLLIIQFSGCSLLSGNQETSEQPLVEPPAVAYMTITAGTEIIDDNFSVTGTFEHPLKSNVYFTRSEGKIATMNFVLGDTVKEGDVILTLDTENLELNIEIQKLSVLRAQRNYDRIKKINDADGTMAFELGNASIDLDTAKLQLEILSRTLERSILYAPISGDLVFIDPAVTLGAYVSSYQLLCTIEDMEDIQLQYSGTEPELLNIKPGLPVTVTYDKIQYDGTVISAGVDFSAGSSQITVKIDVGGIKSNYGPGDQADIKFIQKKARVAVVIPPQAIKTSGSTKYVEIFEDGIRKKRDIVTGFESDTQVEVIEGLKEGDRVILD
jgi:RND family efflux transporter MFP subunit